MIGAANNGIVHRGRTPFVGSRKEAVLPAVLSRLQQETGVRLPKWQVSESNTSAIRASTARSAHGESVGSSKAHENFAKCAPIGQRPNVKLRRQSTTARSTSHIALRNVFGNRKILGFSPSSPAIIYYRQIFIDHRDTENGTPR
jgi:hypothetical protein